MPRSALSAARADHFIGVAPARPESFRSALPRFVGRARHLSSCSGDFMSPHYLLQGYQPRPAFKCFIFNQFRTLCEKPPGWGLGALLTSHSSLQCATTIMRDWIGAYGGHVHEWNPNGSDRADDGAHPGGLVRDGMRNRARRRKTGASGMGG